MYGHSSVLIIYVNDYVYIRVFNIVDGFVLFMSKLLHCSLINQLAFTSYAD